METELVIYGAGGFAREVAWAAESGDSSTRSRIVTCFVSDDADGRLLHQRPVLTLHQARQTFPNARMVVAVGSPHIRQKLAERALAAGFDFGTVRHHSVESSPSVSAGNGSVICARTVLTVDIRLGDHAQINLACTIGHDVTAGDYLTLSPGVHVSGWVHFGHRVFVGTGAVFVNGADDKPLVIGDDAVIGAGAVVTRDVPPGVTVVGIPAKPR